MITDGATCQIKVDINAVAPRGKLREAIGIGTLGGAFTPLLSKGTRLPCAWWGTFSTAEDGQSQLFVHVFRGNTKRADEAVSLGRFEITGMRLRRT
jgi:molecular chaperone DnaK (HSP70)